jgi:hypothetical protein
MNLRKVTLKYACLVVFIHNDSAEIWGFRYRLTLVIGTLKIIASTGVFVRVFCALKHYIMNFSSPPSIILNSINKATTANRWALREIFTRESYAQNNRTPTETIGKFDKIEYLDD